MRSDYYWNFVTGETLILARLTNKLKSLRSEIPIVLGMDSMTTLCWIKNERIWKQYVGQRVDEIRHLTAKESWRHCPGEVNPADIHSRGLTTKELSTSEIWWNGPRFLHQPDNQWSEMTQPVETKNKEILGEVSKNEPLITHSMVNTSPSHQGIDRIIDIEHYNNIMSLLRVTTYVIRFVNNLKTNQRSQRNLKELRADELKNTKTLWIKSVQASVFIEGLSFLNWKDRKATPPIWVTQFGLFQSKDHTIKCKGRINNASLLPSTKSSLLLPAKHTFLSPLVKQAHDLVKHSGITATLTTLRERFWVLRGRETVKKILQHCIVCKDMK